MTQTNAAQDEPWWEEFTQAFGKESLRSLAKRFGTNPRRLRRAAQRCGLADEPPELLEAAGRLGTCPDDSLAADIGVTPELVKGARVRRKIAAFNPKTLPKPKVRKPKKAKPQRPARPPRERYSRSEPVVPTVVVKRTRSRLDTERPTSRVDEGAQKLANTLGRIRSEEPPPARATEEAESPRRRRVVSSERAEEMRGLKPASLPTLSEGDGRTRRRRMPRVASRKTSTKEGGDDDPSGERHSALAAARISKALNRAAAHAEPSTAPPSPPVKRELSKPTMPPAFVPEPAVKAPVEQVQEALPSDASLTGTAERSLSPVAHLAAPRTQEMAAEPPPTWHPVTSTAEPAQEMRLWTAEYANTKGPKLTVIAAPTFLDALERAQDLGELIKVEAAPAL